MLQRMENITQLREIQDLWPLHFIIFLELKTYCFVKVTFFMSVAQFSLMAYFFPYLSFKETSTQDECTDVKEVSLAPQHIGLIIF